MYCVFIFIIYLPVTFNFVYLMIYASSVCKKALSLFFINKALGNLIMFETEVINITRIQFNIISCMLLSCHYLCEYDLIIQVNYIFKKMFQNPQYVISDFYENVDSLFFKYLSSTATALSLSPLML